MRQFIQDKEIDLTKERDLLGTTCYAEELVKAINNIPEGKSCTIGMYASWGSGKSTIISTAKSLLERREDKKVKVVVYDAWKYANDSFRRMFLLHLQHDLRLKETAEMERFYKNVTEEVEPRITVRQKGLWITISVLALLWVGVGILDAVGATKNSMTWAALISFASVVIALFNGVFYDLKVSQTKNVLFAPEQFEACFCQMMVAVLKKNTGLLKAYHRVADFVKGDENSVHDLDKLVIVVDNIDRCNNETAYSLLTDIKTFLCNEAFDVVFVVPVDDGALKKHLFANSEISEENNRDVEEYLRKFFNVIVRIRDHRHVEMLHYVHALNEEYHLNLNNNTLSLVAKEYAKNPRRIVQLLNNLTIEQSLYDDEFAQKNETLIAALLIIREEYPLMIDEVLKNRTIISVDFDHREDGKGALNPKLNNNPEFLSFMRMAKQTFINSEPEDLMRILTNTQQALNSLTDDLIKSITSFDSNTVLESVKSGGETRCDVLAFIEERLKEDDEFDAEDDILNYIDLIAEVNAAIELTETELQALNERMHRCYPSVGSKLTHVQSITKLAYNLDQINQGELKGCLFEYIKDKSKGGEKWYHLYVDEILKVFCGKDDSSILQPFAEEYFYGAASVIERNWTADQLEFLFSNEFVHKWVDSITSFTDTKAQETLVWCLENLTGTTDITYQLIVSKVSALWGTSDGKTEEEFTKLFDFVNPLLHAMRNDVSMNKEQLAEFVKLVLAERRLPGAPSSTRLSPVSIGCGAVLSDVLVEFWFEVYRLVGGDSLPVKHLTSLLKQSEQTVKQYLLGILDENKDVSFFRDCISNLAIADTEMFRLLPVLYEKKSDGTYYCDESVMSDKIVVLLSHLENTEAVEVIARISQDEYIKDMVLDKIALDNYDYLNKLPSKLLNLVLGVYNEESRNAFEMNNAFLSIILQKGTTTQKELVKKTLLSRLVDGKDRAGVIELMKYCRFRKSEQTKFDALLKDDGEEEEGE